MRIYSNTLLSWPTALHVTQTARIYPGRWLNYYSYKISNIEPLVLTTHSPIELLQENCKYYCYDKYYRDCRPEVFGNTLEKINISNQHTEFGKETWAYIPKVADINDIIIIKSNINNGTPSIYTPSLFINPLHPLA
jgi:hypothetical protein